MLLPMSCVSKRKRRCIHLSLSKMGVYVKIFNKNLIVPKILWNTLYSTRPSLNSLFLNTVNWIYHALKALCSLERWHEVKYIYYIKVHLPYGFRARPPHSSLRYFFVSSCNSFWSWRQCDPTQDITTTRMQS